MIPSNSEVPYKPSPSRVRSYTASILQGLPYQGDGVDVLDSATKIQWYWNGAAYVRGSTGAQIGATVTVTSWGQVQAAHDAIKLLGFGTIVFDPTNTFIVPAGGGVSIDTYSVGIDYNYAPIDFSGMANGEAAFTFYGSHVGHQFTGYADRGGNREYRNAYMYGGDPITRPYSTDVQSQNVAFRLDSTVTGTSNQCQFINPKIIGAYKGWDVRSASYVVRVLGGRTTRCRRAANMDNDGTITDFAEIFAFRDHLFAENGLHLYDGKGNQWRFDICHFDYHIDRVLDIKGSKVIATGCHFEWNTGDTPGDTLCPFLFTSAGGHLIIKGGVIAYQDKNAGNYQPYYPGIFDMSDNSQVLVIDDVEPVNLGRRGETTSHDAAVYVSAASIVVPFVDIKWHATGVSLTDLPSMTMVQDIAAGVIGGCLRDSGTPFNELGWRTSVTGTAVISSVTVDENGVTRKNGQNMMKITGAGKVTIAMPMWMRNRRHAWQFFTATSTATSVFAGSVTIKERQGGYGAKFDGTTVTLTPDSRGAQYGAATVTINTASATWARRSWKNCTDRQNPRLPMNDAGCVPIEIDTTGMTGGAFYISHPAYDLT